MKTQEKDTNLIDEYDQIQNQIDKQRRMLQKKKENAEGNETGEGFI